MAESIPIIAMLRGENLLLFILSSFLWSPSFFPVTVWYHLHNWLENPACFAVSHAYAERGCVAADSTSSEYASLAIFVSWIYPWYKESPVSRDSGHIAQEKHGICRFHFFFHPDFTVGFGFAPNQPVMHRVVDSHNGITTGRELHTTPKTFTIIYFIFIFRLRTLV